MVTYYVKKGELYKVSATVNCAVYDANNLIIYDVDGGETGSFKAPTDKISLSDDNATLTRFVTESSVSSGALNDHVANSDVHVTSTEKANWNNILNNVSYFNTHIDDDTVHFTEDRVDYLLKDKLYAQGEYTTTNGSDNFNANAFEVSDPPIKTISRIAIPCRSELGGNTGFYGDAPVYLCVFEKDENETWRHVGTSTNSHVQERGVTGYYEFNSLELSGRPILLTIVTNANNTTLDASLVIGARVTATSDGGVLSHTGVAYTDAQLTTRQQYLIQVTFTGEKVEEIYAPKSHVGDSSHLTESDRSILNEMASRLTELEANTVSQTCEETTYDTVNAVMITNASGEATASTVITVAELNTLNGCATNIANKLADLENRLAALENA